MHVILHPCGSPSECSAEVLVVSMSFAPGPKPLTNLLYFHNRPQTKQGRIHRRFSRVLLGRGSNNTVYTTSGARRVVTDCLHRSKSLIALILLVFATSDGRTDGRTDRPTDRPT